MKSNLNDDANRKLDQKIQKIFNLLWNEMDEQIELIGLKWAELEKKGLDEESIERWKKEVDLSLKKRNLLFLSLLDKLEEDEMDYLK